MSINVYSKSARKRLQLRQAYGEAGALLERIDSSRDEAESIRFEKQAVKEIEHGRVLVRSAVAQMAADAQEIASAPVKDARRQRVAELTMNALALDDLQGRALVLSPARMK